MPINDAEHWYYRGKPLNTLSREELLEALVEELDYSAKRIENLKETLELAKQCYKPRTWLGRLLNAFRL